MELGCPELRKHNTCLLNVSMSLYSSHRHKHVPDIAELVVHVPHVVFDVDRDAGRLQHLHVELLREGTDEQGSDRVDAGDLVGHAELLGLVSVLKVQHTCRQEGDRRGTGGGQEGDRRGTGGGQEGDRVISKKCGKERCSFRCHLVSSIMNKL